MSTRENHLTPVSRRVIFIRARVSLALLSLWENGGQLLVEHLQIERDSVTAMTFQTVQIHFLSQIFSTVAVACVAGVKRGRGRGRGNLGARVVSRPNSLPLPFRTPATQATVAAVAVVA